MSETAQHRVLSGKAWEEFCDKLKAAGEVILRPESPATELDRAEGWRYLSRLTRIALDMMLECADPDFPEFYMASHTTAKIGADNPDNIYFNATVSGDREYVIRGNRGTVKYLSIASRANRYAIDGTMADTGVIDVDNMHVDANGNFEIVVSQTPQNGNWLPMQPDTSMILVRQTFLDRKQEMAANMAISRRNGPAHPNPLSAARLDKSLMSAAAFVHGTARTFASWSELFRKHTNQMPDIDQAFFQKAGGDPSIYYIHGYWELQPDEALVIDTQIPECQFWNFQVDNYWMESLDYRYNQIHINPRTATYNKDGSVTIVVGHQNPGGVANFLTTDGHTSGTSLLRWVNAKSHPLPTCKVVKIASLKK
ncbi:MAG: DUF1214 domain-containing protein [Rhodospirillaceae bacterium]|nr:DUF1214 domain-containing protein [Rhodospirillaceae bacterium]